VNSNNSRSNTVTLINLLLTGQDEVVSWSVWFARVGEMQWIIVTVHHKSRARIRVWVREITEKSAYACMATCSKPAPNGTLIIPWIGCTASSNPTSGSWFCCPVLSCHAGFYAAAGKVPRFWWGYHTNHGFSRNWIKTSSTCSISILIRQYLKSLV